MKISKSMKKITSFGRLSKLPLSEKEKKKIRSLQSDFGVETSEEEIDLVVYGVKR